MISPTYPGLGASQSNNGRTFLSFGEDVRELLDHLQIKEFILGGVSFGGPHSAAVLAACMDRVSGWFLISPVVGGCLNGGPSGDQVRSSWTLVWRASQVR